MIVRIITVTTDAHWEQLRGLSRDLQLFEQSIRPQRKDFSAIAQGSFRYMQRNVQERNGIALLALNEADDAVGFMTGWAEDSDGLDTGHAQTGEISDVYVHPRYRRTGVLTQMLNRAARHFKDVGLDRLTLSTLAANTDMQTALNALGFTPHKISFERPIHAGQFGEK